MRGHKRIGGKEHRRKRFEHQRRFFPKEDTFTKTKKRSQKGPWLTHRRERGKKKAIMRDFERGEVRVWSSRNGCGWSTQGGLKRGDHVLCRGRGEGKEFDIPIDEKNKKER